MTITSSDPTLVLLSEDATTDGTASIVLGFGTGGLLRGFYAQGLADSGSVQLTATAPGYTSDETTVTLTPSGFAIPTFGLPFFPFYCTTTSGDTPFEVTALVLDPATLKVIGSAFPLRPGAAPVSVPVISSDTNVGTVSPPTFNAGDGRQFLTFHPVGLGMTTVSMMEPTGFSTPSTPGWVLQFDVAVRESGRVPRAAPPTN